MIAKRPSVFIYENDGDRELLKELCAGMEEEGVFFEIFAGTKASADTLAWQAANDSMMGTGIGISKNKVVLQMKGLPVGKNVESYTEPTKEQCRIAGADSARIMKKMILKG